MSQLRVRAANFVYQTQHKAVVTQLPTREAAYAVLRDMLVLRSGMTVKGTLFGAADHNEHEHKAAEYVFLVGTLHALLLATDTLLPGVPCAS